MRLIDADALYETLVTGDIRETHQFCYPCKNVLEAIDAQPTVEPQRMKGRWIKTENEDDNGNVFYVCSVCNYSDVHSKTMTVPYCWQCGAEMGVE